jgi:hypothetical protein
MCFLYKHNLLVLQTAIANSIGTRIKDQIKPSCIKIHNTELNTEFCSTTIHENEQINRVSLLFEVYMSRFG